MRHRTPAPRHSVLGAERRQTRLMPVSFTTPASHSARNRPGVKQHESAENPLPRSLYHQLHALGHSQKINSRTLGRDDALTALWQVRSDSYPSRSRRVQRQFDYLCVNRATKYRHRMRLDRRSEGDTHNPVEKHTEAVATKELVGLIRRELSESDWSILWMLAEGFTYGELADKFGIAVEKLKSRERDPISNP